VFFVTLLVVLMEQLWPVAPTSVKVNYLRPG